MTVKEIVQKRYEIEIKSLSAQARMIISSNFSDFSRLMVFHERGPYVFNSFTSSEIIKQELFDFSNRLFTIYVKEQIGEWKRLMMQDASYRTDIALETIIDKYLEKTYRLILKTQGQFVRSTMKINCPHYPQALYFVNGVKSVNDFLRCSENERRELILFFDMFGEIYKEIITFYNQKKEIWNKIEPPSFSKIVTDVPNTESNLIETPRANTKTVKIHKPQHKKKKRSSETRHLKNEPERSLDDNNEEIVDNNPRLKKYNDVSIQDYSKSPSFYDTPCFFFDELTMMATINYGCNGSVSFGLSSNFISPSFPFLYNFEREIIKYDPDEIYRKPIVSDRISRSAYRYKWFGVNGNDYMISLKKFGIAAKCVNLYFGEYICFVPVEIEEYDGKYLAKLETTDDNIISILSQRKDLIQFLEYETISLRDFKLMEITDKLYCLCDYYDIYDFLGLDEELYEKNEVILDLQATMSKKTIDEFLWDSYTLDEKNDFLMRKVKALRNKEAYLRFNIVRINYLPNSKEMEISYLIHSEYSIEVFVNIDILYKDGALHSFPHIKVDSYDDRYIYFQGKTRIRSEIDYLQIQLIKMTCSDE